MIVVRLIAVLAVVAGVAPAAAASFGVEAASDLRRRGLSWSGGDPAVEAWGSIPVAGGFSIEAGAATLRGSPRHGGADALGDAALRYTKQTGPWTLWGDVQGVGFAGASGQDFLQLRAGSALGIGPVQVSVQTAWAPSQGAIGGSNLYVAGRASIGVIGTPLTLAAGVGRSTGTDDGSGRSERLRPGGDYTDFRVDADYVVGPVTLGASFTATSVGEGYRDSGSRVLVRAAVGF